MLIMRVLFIGLIICSKQKELRLKDQDTLID